jgi:enoyl-CoA hydratase
MEHVRVEHHDAVAVVTLVDAARRNAMTAPMVEEIVATFDALEAGGTTAAVVITGEPPAFCSGADVSSLGALAESSNDHERRSVTSIYEGFLRVLRSPLPTVAAVNGAAVGAGMNLALACDVRLAGTSARFDTRFVKIGLHPGGGHTWMLERAVGPQAAAAMVLFGVVVEGARAAEIGLAWSCHPDAALLDAAVEFAAGAARAPIPLLGRTKATLRQAPWQPGFDEAVATEVTHQAWSLGQGWFGKGGKSGKSDSRHSSH